MLVVSVVLLNSRRVRIGVQALPRVCKRISESRSSPILSFHPQYYHYQTHLKKPVISLYCFSEAS